MDYICLEGLTQTHLACRTRHRFGKRAGISELMATVLTIAITLIAGAALFGYVNGMAANSESAIGVSNANNVNFLNERFVSTDMGFSGTSSAVIWVYNNGNVTLGLKQITLFDSTKNSLYVVYNNTPSGSGCGSISSPKNGAAPGFNFGSTGTKIPAGSNPYKITLNLPASCSFVSGTTYYVSVLGLYGYSATYFAVKP